MKIPALMTPKNAVTASNMVAIPDPAIQPNALRARTVKRIPREPKISKLNDDFEQQASRLASAWLRKSTGAPWQRFMATIE
jgi:hypothetical protein